MQIFILWFIIRCMTSIFVGMGSEIRPMTVIERAIPFFSPTLPLSQWFERSFLSPWMRWDALWYQRIVSQGYSATDGTAPFHPLYPLLATPLARLGIPSSLSLLLISSIAGLSLFYYFDKLARFDLSPKDGFFALTLFTFSPPAFILFAPYPESLFILAAVLCLLFSRQKKWWLAGLMGGIATLTRQQGIFLLFPLTVELWENSKHDIKTIIKQWRDWLTLSLIPISMLVWILFRAFSLNDFELRISNIQEFIYSTLISPSANRVVPIQKFIWPWQALYYSLMKLTSIPDIDIWVNIITGALFLIVLIIAWRNLRLSYRVYSLVIFVISLSFYTGPIHPYMGLPRHLLLAFPIFIGFASAVKNSWVRLTIIGLSAIAMLFLLLLYVLNTWVP
jgi:Gpi18-like mannosyltransferase